MNEFEIIEKYFKPLTNNAKEAVGLANDTAQIKVKRNFQLVVSKDIMVEDIHFKLADGGFNIGSKLLSSNLSDLAASGAEPLYYMIGFSKNKNVDEKFIENFCEGLKSVADQHNISLIGGDSVKSGKKLFFSLTIFGQTRIDQILTRSGAKKGDLIMVSGFIGDAFLGLKIAQNELPAIPSSGIGSKITGEYLLSRHFKPTPRISLGQTLLNKKLASSAIDVSDGLFADLKHICEASNLSATIHQEKIPTSTAAKMYLQKNKKISVNDLAAGGDDYELIFTIKEENLKTVKSIGRKLNVELACIGTMNKTLKGQSSITLINKHNQKIDIVNYGYKHY